MKEFLLLFRGGEARLDLSPEDMQEHMQRWMQWMAELGKQGKFAGAQPLVKTGRVVTGTKKVISDGPFMEGKEILGGYLICKVSTYDEAVKIAEDCPVLEFNDGTVEVREIGDMKM